MTYETGRFRAKATTGELGYANTGTEQVAVQFEILEGPDAGKNITWWGYFTDKTADRTLRALMDAGWDGKDVAILNGLGAKEVSVVIEDDTYNGETRQRIRWINPLGNGPVSGKQMSDSEKTSFADRMKGRTLHLQNPAESPDLGTLDADRNEKTGAAVAADDDIPF